MNAAQSNTFIRMMQNTPTVLNDARIIPMESDSQKSKKSASVSAFYAQQKKAKRLMQKTVLSQRQALSSSMQKKSLLRSI